MYFVYVVYTVLVYLGWGGALIYKLQDEHKYKPIRPPLRTSSRILYQTPLRIPYVVASPQPHALAIPSARRVRVFSNSVRKRCLERYS